MSIIFFYPHPDSVCDVAVTAVANSLIQDLWKLATEQEPSLAAHIGEAKCIFYIPDNLSIEPSATLLSRSRDWLRQHRDDGPKAISIQMVNSVFPQVPPGELVHVLVVTEELLEGLDYLGDPSRLAFKQRVNSIKTFRSSFPTPSEGVKTAGVDEVVNRNKNRFHAGRPAGNFGPPVSLFNHALGRFDHALSHLDDGSSFVDLHPSLLRMAHTFLTVALDHYPDESTWMTPIKMIFDQIFSIPINWAFPRARFGLQPDAINADGPPFFVVELNNEAGIEGDASLQAALSYTHMVTSSIDKNSQLPSNYPAALSNCPAVLYGIMGNLFEIGVAMYTDGSYSNLLFSERLVSDFHIAKNVLRLA